MDDVFVFGKTVAEHDANLRTTLTRIQEAGLTLNQDKCIFGVKEVTFLGHKLSGDGVAVDESKVAAILKLPDPGNVKDLRMMLGMVQHLAKFLPDFAQRAKLCGIF